MRHLFDQYLAYGTVRLSKVKGFESAEDALFTAAERTRQVTITSDTCKNLPLLKQTIYQGEIPMDSKVYLDQKVQQGHYQELLREAEKRRLLAQLPKHRRSISRYAAGKFGLFLLKLGAWLKQFEQSPTMYKDHV
jgi:hypothetical protein